MKNKIKECFAIILCIAIISNSITFNVIASDIDPDENDTLFKDWEIVEELVEDDTITLKKLIEKGGNFISFLLGSTGAIYNGDLEQLVENNDYYNYLNNQVDTKKIQVVKNVKTGKKGIRIKKDVTDELLNNLKEQNKEPDNGGYELVKTVPASKISSLYFSSPARYTTFKNLLKDNGGIIGLKVYGGYANCYYKILPDVFWVSGGKYLYKDSNGTHEFYRADGYKNTLSSVVNYNAYDISKADTPAKSWDDVGTNLYMSSASSHGSYRFSLNDSFTYFADSKNVSNPLTQGAYLVTATGAPIPVFNSISDAVAYSVANNLYYTSSDYTGEGKEIIIPFDEIDKILNGYYNGMYDLLQQLIEQNGGNALTPEQLQKLVDEVKASFGMIQDSINSGFEQQDILIQKNSQILQNIADALNAFFKQTKEFREYLGGMIEDYLKNGAGGGTGGNGTGDYYIKIKSVPNDSLEANQREFTIETNIGNPYWESCLAWYPLNGVSDIQYTNGGTCILTFFNYNRRYNVYCKYNDTGQGIRCTSNTVSVTIGAPGSDTAEPDGWDRFKDNVYQFFTDIMNKLDELFYDENGMNYFKMIREDIGILSEQCFLFFADCRQYLRDIIKAIGNIRIGSPIRPPSGSGVPDVIGNFLDFLTDTGELATDKVEEKAGDLISGMLDVFGTVVDVLTEKFPFSIPWDILAIITALAAEPAPPHFEIPVVIEHYGISESYVIDFSEYQFLSDISRTFLTIIWTMYLMNFTTKFTDTRRK